MDRTKRLCTEPRNGIVMLSFLWVHDVSRVSHDLWDKPVLINQTGSHADSQSRLSWNRLVPLQNGTEQMFGSGADTFLILRDGNVILSRSGTNSNFWFEEKSGQHQIIVSYMLNYKSNFFAIYKTIIFIIYKIKNIFLNSYRDNLIISNLLL